uniref:DNA-directed RNA polymerase III subunit RPC5 n=1 Tax=Romanomermis culicivorax TaxID=13658 RepID=A0A915K900_ROMCU
MDSGEEVAGSSSSYEVNSRKRAILEDEDDEVLHEIDVVVSNKYAKSLYLLQYPLTPAAARLPSKQRKTVQFKPKQCKLQIKCEMDTGSRNYDKIRGEQLALNCAPNDKNKEPIFKKLMDYQIYTNENVAGLHTNCYAIGYYVDGALHLNPLDEILQMKPTFNYLDAADEKSGRSQKTGMNDGGETSGDETAEPAVQAVRVKFAAANIEESEAAKKRKNASFAYKQKLMEEEKWIPLQYRPRENQNVEELKAMLTYEEREVENQATQKPLLFSNDSSSLMRLFIPEAEQEEGGLPETPSDTISLSQLRTLPLPDQVQALMTNGKKSSITAHVFSTSSWHSFSVKVMQYDKLIPLLPPGADSDVVLKSLQNCACLVQGCWIVKSELLYPRHMKSPKSGLSGEYLCRIRDLVLYKFRQNPYLDKKEITSCVKINNEDLTDILKPISKFRQQKGYQFLIDCDEGFLK